MLLLVLHIKTAQMIAEVRPSTKQGHPSEEETIAGASGADFRWHAYSLCSFAWISCSSTSIFWRRRTTTYTST